MTGCHYYYAISLSAWETTNMKTKTKKLEINKRLSKRENADEMQMPMRDIS